MVNEFIGEVLDVVLLIIIKKSSSLGHLIFVEQNRRIRCEKLAQTAQTAQIPCPRLANFLQTMSISGQVRLLDRIPKSEGTVMSSG
ncbi:hypothetical protein XPA_003946 [Xanthoria parietina]